MTINLASYGGFWPESGRAEALRVRCANSPSSCFQGAVSDRPRSNAGRPAVAREPTKPGSLSTPDCH